MKFTSRVYNAVHLHITCAGCAKPISQGQEVVTEVQTRREYCSVKCADSNKDLLVLTMTMLNVLF